MKILIVKLAKKYLSSLNERGFTLMELLAVIGIVGMISGVMSMSIIMMMKVNAESSDQAVALQRVQNAGQWLSIDVQTAQAVTVDNNPATETFITLTVPVAGEDDNTIIYKLENDEGTIKKLTRTDQDSGTTFLIAEYIYYEPGSINSTEAAYNEINRTLTVRVTAIADSATTSKQYQITQRIDPDEEEG